MTTNTCAGDDCDRPVYARSYCGRHYKQLLRHGRMRRDLAPVECAVPGCGRRAVTRGWCHGHYLRWSRQGDVKAHVPLARPQRDTCAVADCERGAHSAGLCRSHAMAEALGRPLRGDEVVHHRNGNRLDNRMANLELWTTAQPKGQRVADKVAFARELLDRYAAVPTEFLATDEHDAPGRDNGKTCHEE